MAAREVVQLAVLTFKSSPEPPAAFFSASSRLQSIPGVSDIHLGRHFENPDQYTWLIRWVSTAALDAYLASPSYPAWIADVRSVLDTYVVSRAAIHGDLGATLAAPCTEVFSCFDVTDEYLERRPRKFLTNLADANLDGMHAWAYGGFEVASHHGVEPPTGKTLVGAIGWDSKEAHLAQRGDGKVIDNNVHIVLEGSSGVDMYHTTFKKL